MNFNDEEYKYDDEELDVLDFPLSESDESENENKIINTNISMKDRVDMINLRSKINILKENISDKREIYLRIKEELAICDNHVLELKKEENLTKAAIETNQATGNIAAVYRLQGQLKRVLIEQEGENDVHDIIKQRLVDAEQQFIKSQLEEAKYMIEGIHLNEDEEMYRQAQELVQRKRINNDVKLTKNIQRTLEVKKSETAKSMEDQEKQQNELQQSIAEAHSKHSKYLHKTSKEQREIKEKLAKKKREEEVKKELSFQKLKTDILQTKENMTAINSKRKAEELEQKLKESNLQLSAIEKGGNPKLELKKYKNNIKMSNEDEQFRRNIKEGKVKVAEKISGEERNLIRKKNLMPYLFEGGTKSIKRTVLGKADLISQDKTILEDQKDIEQEKWKTWDIRSSAGRSSVDQVKDLDDGIVSDYADTTYRTIPMSHKDDNDVDINNPEFQGMWNTTVDYKVPKEAKNLPIKNENASKMDQEIMQRVLGQLKDNIVQPQVVGGKLFKGKSFQSKPEVIQFENLEVGQVYTQKITLTNTSYGTNQCRFERISEQLLDFIAIKFSPSGPLSPGMTFDFIVTFEPKLDQDLNGEVFFTSQSERFSIPLVCLTKKCKMAIDKETIKFNTSVIGETLIQSVLLKNTGAKGTFCTICNSKKINKSEEVGSLVVDNPEDAVIEDNSDPHEDEYDCISTSLGDNKLWIDPYKEQEVIVQWSPTIAGDYLEDFHIRFDDEDNKGFDLRVVANAIDVPVYINESVVSMDICMVDRLYQDTLIFHSRAATALKMQFKVPEPVRDYLEILPNMGFIQAGQEFKVQLKLLVKSSIYNENCHFFDKDTGILDVPISANIANQVKTVDFNVQAVLTGTDLELESSGLDPSLVDFGYCTINETSVTTIRLRNRSILAQEFGFTGYPDYVEIQPNHGYGVILPKEELEFQLMFSPTKADNFQFNIRCQTIIDKSFMLSCRGVGVHPSLELSNQIVTFPHTAINDMSSSDIFLVNNHISTNIYTHEPPRIGTDPVIPVGPKTYQFILPDNVDVDIHPRVGTINPGEKQKLTLFFNPKLSDDSIKKEAAQTINNALEKEAQQKWEDEIKELEKLKDQETIPVQSVSDVKTENKGKKSSKKPVRPTSEKRSTHDVLYELMKAGPQNVQKIEPDQIVTDSDEYLKGKLSLLQKFDFNFEIIKARCLIADGAMVDADLLTYNWKNILYLEMHCPCVRPDFVILSNGGRPVIDFGQHILQSRVTRVISVQNISSDIIKMRSSDLNPNGAFQICNALRDIEPNAVANVVVSFVAKDEGIYESNWSIYGKKRSKMLKLKFKAMGIIPRLEIKELKDGVINAGTVMINEFVEKPITLVNNSTIDIQYRLELSSKDDYKQQFGVNNKNGCAVFTLTPQMGIIAAGKSQIVTLTFSSDHESTRFSVLASLYLCDKVKHLQFNIRGESKSKVVYLKNSAHGQGRPLEYLGEIWSNIDQQNEDATVDVKTSNNLVLLLRSSLSEEGTVIEGKGCFTIGCVRTMALSQKKNGEFTIDNMNILTPLGFSIDNVKGQIEADSEKDITVSWIPPPQYVIGSLVSANLSLTLKGDTSSTYIIELRAYVK